MKKALSLVLALALLLSVTAAFAEKTQLTLWSIAVEGDANRAAYLAAIEEFNKTNEDYELVMEATENEAYKTKIKAAMSAGEDLPDIFFTWSMSFLGDFVDAGRVYNLDGILPEYKEELTDTMLANTTYNGEHYGVPLTMNVVTLFANMDLIKSVGYDAVPETFEGLMELCAKLKEAGIVPFGVAGKENWCLSEYTEPLLVAAALGNEEVKQNFIAGKTAFYQNGSWNCGDIAKAANFEVAALAFPTVAEGADLYQFVGGPNDTLAVTATAKDPELCAKIAFDLGRIIAREGNLNGAGLPAWAVNYDTSSCNKLSNQVADMLGKSTGLVLFGDNFLSADAANTYLDFIAQLFAGDIDAQGFADGLAEAFPVAE